MPAVVRAVESDVAIVIQPIIGPRSAKLRRIMRLRIENTVALTDEEQCLLVRSFKTGVA